MKVRKFYPRQVLRRLQGEYQKLDAAQLAILRYAMRKGRKLGISMFTGSCATREDLLTAANAQEAKAIIENANVRLIFAASDIEPYQRLGKQAMTEPNKILTLDENPSHPQNMKSRKHNVSTESLATFQQTFSEKLLAMSDESVLEGHDPEALKSENLAMVAAAKAEAERRNPTPTKDES